MLNILLYIHLAAALVTAALVTQQRRHEIEAKGRLLLLAVTMVAMALVAWPFMLLVAWERYMNDSARLR